MIRYAQQPAGVVGAAAPLPQESESAEGYLEKALRDKGVEPSVGALTAARGLPRNIKRTTPAPVRVVDFQRPTILPVSPRGRLKPAPEKEVGDRALVEQLCAAYKHEKELPEINGRKVNKEKLCGGK